MDPITIAGALKLVTMFAPDAIKFFTGSDKAANVTSAVLGVANAVTGTSTPEAAANVLALDPAKALEFQQAMLAADADMTKAQLVDVQNARHLQEVALGQDDLFSKRFVYYLAAAWSLFAMLYFTGVTFIKIEPAGQRVADTVLGVLISSVLGGIMAYFYGSTKNSAEKTRLLAASTPK